MATYQENFFTRGPSPLARVTFFSLIAIAVMIADHRFQALDVVRFGVSTALNPLEQALAWPARGLTALTTYFRDQDTLISENKALTEKILSLAADGQRAQLVAAEHKHVTALEAANNRFQREGIIAEIIRDARNPFARKIIINRGMSDGIKSGAVVIDGVGVVGQITNLGMTSAEVTLTTEKDQSVPVMVVRNSLRAVAVGNGREGAIEMPFMPVATDILVGDTLVTSGIDGVYPAGLSVGTVTVVDKNPAFSFARVVALPTSAPNHHRFVKVLLAPVVASAANAAIDKNKAANYPVPDVIASDGANSALDKTGSRAETKREAKLSAKRALRQETSQR
jgi:rod shape-determining protein MreC